MNNCTHPSLAEEFFIIDKVFIIKFYFLIYMLSFIKFIQRFHYWNTAFSGTKFVMYFETILGFLDF